MTDLMAWNADATRMPYRMHSEYLRKMFLNNELAEGASSSAAGPHPDGHPRAILRVGTVNDHVAPWRSVHKIRLLADTEVTFVLTSGGHNAGIVSEPGHPRRTYRIATGRRRAIPMSTRTSGWRASLVDDGSWWPAWFEWLARQSSQRIAPPPLDRTDYPALDDAPGSYVREH